MTGSNARKIWFVGLVLAGAALACTAPGQNGAQTAPSTTAPGVVTAAPVNPTAAPSNPTAAPTGAGQTQQASGDPTAACPTATDGTTRFISKENGVCFLVPSEMKTGPVNDPGARQAAFYGPVVDPGAPSPLSAGIQVTYNGPADVADSAAYAKKWHDVFLPGTPDPVPATVGGQPAALIAEIPGMLAQQEAFVVANGQKYTITSPKPGQYTNIDDLVNKAWNTVTGSMVFFQPTDVPKVIHAEDVCPKAAGDNLALIDWGGGVCMLYPKSFEIDPQNAVGRGWFNGGPELGKLESMPVRANLAVANAGPTDGKSPRQLWENFLVNKDALKMDVAGAKDVTLSGQPALVWIQAVPIGSRQAIIAANGQMYTIVNQPYSDPNYAGGADNVELVWNTVTQSLAFFDPWR